MPPAAQRDGEPGSAMYRRSHPIVGIPTHSRYVAMAGLPPAFIMGQLYTQALAQAGAAAILLPLYEDPALLRTLYEQIDGLFLAGGSDVNPALYEAEPHSRLGEVDEERDRVELQCIEWALADRLPILAICRGMQVLNVAHGGSLYQDIAAEVPHAMEHNYWQQQPRDYLAHPVEVLPGTRLATLLGTHHTLVNSLHHQAVRTLAAGLRPSARAADGILEALESTDPGQFVVGVQWHPEALTSDPKMLRLFTGFVDAVQEVRLANAA
jgi:putative glutamine amidotransferase